MRVGFINTEIDMGGSSRAMQRTIAALNAAGHETVVITLAAKGESEAPVIRIQDHTVGPVARRAGVAHFLYNGRYVDRNRTALSDTLFWIPAVGLNLAEVVGRLDLDVLNVHWTSYFLSLMSLDQLMDLPTPVVFTLHDMAHFTGGCHYSAGCRGFETDCAPCPQLSFDPLGVPRDVRRNRASVYARQKPWAIAPSAWMAERAKASGLFGDDRVAHVANTLRLLNLPEATRKLLSDGAISAGHGRALLAVDHPDAVARRIVEEGLTVRDIESLGKAPRAPETKSAKSPAAKLAAEKDADTRAMEKLLSDALGMKIAIKIPFLVEVEVNFETDWNRRT